MVEGQSVVAALESSGFTHLVWIPDSAFGRWDSALSASRFAPIRPAREGEAVAIAAGLLLGGASPLVVMQCTGFFEAGDAVRNVVHDLHLPLKLLVGVRGYLAYQAGSKGDSCPRFVEPIVRAWDLPTEWLRSAEEWPKQLLDFHARPGAGVLLWAE